LKKSAVLIFAISVSTLLQAQQKFTKDQLEVQQTIVNLFSVLSERDSVGLRKYCAADIELFEYGSAWNLDTLILKAIILNTASDFRRTNTIDFISTKINGNTAWANYYLHSEISRNGQRSTAHWIETVVAVNERNKWKIKVLHSTLLKRN
jgi:hypothetical protein